MPVERVRWWFVIILTKLFGRTVNIEGSEGLSLRLFLVVWRQKLYLLGSEHEILQIDYTSQHTLRLTKAPWCLVTIRRNVRGSIQSMNWVKIILGRYIPPK